MRFITTVIIEIIVIRFSLSLRLSVHRETAAGESRESGSKQPLIARTKRSLSTNSIRSLDNVSLNERFTGLFVTFADRRSANSAKRSVRSKKQYRTNRFDCRKIWLTITLKHFGGCEKTMTGLPPERSARPTETAARLQPFAIQRSSSDFVNRLKNLSGAGRPIENFVD